MHEFRTAPWLPDGDSQIFRAYVFGPSGFWLLASGLVLCQMAKFDPFFSLHCAHALHPGAMQGRDQMLPSGILAHTPQHIIQGHEDEVHEPHSVSEGDAGGVARQEGGAAGPNSIEKILLEFWLE